MKAALLPGYNEPFTIVDVPTPVPKAGEVLIKIAGAGACHSDLHLKSGEIPMIPSFPWILGHENSGTVAALGPGATGFDVGEPVVVFGGWGCGTCTVCLKGEEQLCDVMRWGGIGVPGGYAEYLLVPSTRHLVRLHDLDPARAAPLADAALTPYRAVQHALARLVPGTVAVSIGVGGLGQYGIRYLKELSTARVVAVDTSDIKRKEAQAIGADVAIDPSEGMDQITEYANGDPVAAVIDYVGSNETLELARAAVGREGIVVIVGLAGGAFQYSFLGVASEATVMGSNWGTRNELEQVVRLARTRGIIGDAELAPLENINEIFERLAHGDIRGRAVLTP